MLQILCSSVRVKLLACAKLIFLREQPDDFFFCGEPWSSQSILDRFSCNSKCLFMTLLYNMYKGDRHSPANYRPISLTCVCAKLLEHIICKQIMSHFSKKKKLTPVQHGFRSKHLCESQLLITTDEFIQNFEGKTQTDVVVLNFSKAFDVVPHQRLLHKLNH